MSTPLISRVIHRIAPHAHEDIYGYLIRVCEKNRLKNADFILAQFVQGRRTLRLSDLEALAFFCRISPEEIQCLSGVEATTQGSKLWQIGDAYVTKANFVDARHTKVCPICLGGDAFARGIWSLTFYLACAIHGVRMVDRCAACQRPLGRLRRHIDYCACGQPLSQLTSDPAPAPLRLVSRLLERHPLNVADLCALSQNIRLADRLQSLSLDGQCKTLWFIGHCVVELDRLASGHGRTRPSLDRAEQIVMQAINGLSRWPDSFGSQIRAHTRRQVAPGSAALIDRLLGPVQYYLYEVTDAEETAFITATYEQYIRQIWRELGATGRTKAFSPQLELPL